MSIREVIVICDECRDDIVDGEGIVCSRCLERVRDKAYEVGKSDGYDEGYIAAENDFKSREHPH